MSKSKPKARLKRKVKAKPKSKANPTLKHGARHEPLGFDLGYRIVSVALNRIVELDSLTPDLTVGQVLPSPQERDLFKQVFQDVLSGYTTESLADVATDSRTTVSSLARLVGSLPGDSGTDDGG